MTHTDADFNRLANALLAHGRAIDSLPETTTKDITVTNLSNGGVMLTRDAVTILIEILKGEADSNRVIIERDWLRHQLTRRGMDGGLADLLTDHISPPRSLCVVLPFTPARG